MCASTEPLHDRQVCREEGLASSLPLASFEELGNTNHGRSKDSGYIGVASCLRTYDEAAGFPPSPLGAEHRVAVEVHRAVLRVLVGSGRLQPLLRHGWVVGGRGLSEPETSDSDSQGQTTVPQLQAALAL